MKGAARQTAINYTDMNAGKQCIRRAEQIFLSSVLATELFRTGARSLITVDVEGKRRRPATQSYLSAVSVKFRLCTDITYKHF
jgi:hypothetical protein